ncbi:MAG: hypothetical protein A4E64_01733 [Syntrophorhabdus sp. PtaU1.Bin058]|nr:MAG: hypothetical protein A4E64_01733 [Syntrophorhabdus sp. PtaU1.Bin058]
MKCQMIEIEKRTWLLPVFAFIGAFAVRFYLALFSNIITPDGILYIRTARLIESGESKKLMEFTFIHLYPYLVLLAHKIFPDWETAGQMVSVLMGSLAVIPLFLLTKRMFGLRIASITALFYIINPRLADYSADVLREPTFWFFSITALWLAREGISRNNPIWIILSNISTILAAFARIEGVAIFIVILFWIIWHFAKEKPNPGRLCLHLFAYIFAFPVLFSPFIFIFKGVFAKWDFGFTLVKIWLLVTSKSGKALALSPESVQTVSPELVTFLELAKNHRYVIFLSDIILRLVRSLNVVFFFLAVVGIFRRRNTPYSKNDIPVAIWFGVFFITAFLYISKVYYFSTRHGTLLVFPMLIWAGIGFFELKEQIRSWLGKVYPSAFFTRHTAAILIAAILIAILPKTLSPGDYEKRELKEAGIYLKTKGYSGTIFAGEPVLYRIAFYADSEYIPLPFIKTEDELAGLMKENKAAFLILDDKTDNALYKNMRTRLDPSVFEKVDLPGLEKFREYSLSLYRLKDR